MMKCNAWTLALLGAGLISLPSVTQAEEKANSVLTALSSTTLSGYVDTSAQWNMGTGNINTPLYAFGGSSKADGFNLNVVKMTLEKPIEAADVWGAGYKVDLIYGPDANALLTQSSLTAADFGVKQAYVSLRAPVGNGLDFKLGVCDTIIGYEVFESVNNPNFTHSYGYTIEPTTHTCLQAAYQFCSVFSATVGVADSVGSTINGRSSPPKAESFKTYMGLMTFTAPTNWGFLSGSTLSGCVISGYNGSLTSSAGVGANQTSFYAGTTVNTPVTGLKVGASYDYLGVPQQTGGISSEYANAFAFYLSYALTEKLTVYGRGEYATTDIPGVYTTVTDGTRRVVAATATLQYDLWKNVLSRLEFRWDHAEEGGPAYGGTRAGDPPDKKNNFILLANVAYKF